MTSPGHPSGPQMRAIRAAARAAVAFVSPEASLGVGTGRTATAFVELLASSPSRPVSAVASSLRTAELLRAVDIEPVLLGEDARLDLYVDGADAADVRLRLLKGGGGAHTGEKRLARAADLFVCMVDESKLVASLGGRAVPVEVRSSGCDGVMRTLAAQGATAVLRRGFVTDGGNLVLDVGGLDLGDPVAVEDWLESLPGVLACGVFARRPADVLLIGGSDGSVEERRLR